MRVDPRITLVDAVHVQFCVHVMNIGYVHASTLFLSTEVSYLSFNC